MRRTAQRAPEGYDGSPNRRLIKASAFYARFSMSEKIAIISSASPIIRAMYKEVDVKMLEKQPINLDHTDVSYGFTELVSEGIVDESRSDALRVDATDEEIFV